MAYLEIKELSKVYPGQKAAVLRNFSLSVASGELVAIVGPSGSGKSTLLNILTGFEAPTTGEIFLAGEAITKLAPKEREMALVFQEYALFPHMTVAENITFGMRIRKVPKAERDKQLAWVATELGLTDLLQAKPKNISGGQRQRVSLARAIVRQPKLFLMDEPLSNLDAKLRDQIGEVILRTHQKIGGTTLFVTHAQDEAMSLADRIVVLAEGVIQQVGTPQAIYQRPKNLFVARFIGKPEINLLPREALGKALAERWTLPSGTETIGIRSEDLFLSDEQEASERGILQQVSYQGSETFLQVSWQDQRLNLRTTTTDHQVGEAVTFQFDCRKMLFFDTTGNLINGGRVQ